MTFSSGDLIFEEKAWAHALLPPFISTNCDGCLLKSSTLQRCSGCHKFHYCSRVCQRSQWRLHKLECKRFVAVGDLPLALPRLILRILILLKEFGKNPMRDMISHAKKTCGNPEVSREFSEILNTLLRFVDDGMEINADEIFSLYCKIKINGFLITNSDLRSTAVAIFPRAAKIDHSCVPNAYYVFYGSSIYFIATEEIKEEKNVRVNYIDLMCTTDERRAICASTYYFRCDCSRCLDTDEDSLLTSIYCCTVIPFSLNKDQPRSHECPTCHRKYSTSVLGRIYERLHATTDEQRPTVVQFAELLCLYIQLRGLFPPAEYAKLRKLAEQNIAEDEDSSFETVKQHFKAIGQNDRSLCVARVVCHLTTLSYMDLLDELFLCTDITDLEQDVIHSIMVAASIETIRWYEGSSLSWMIGHFAKMAVSYLIALHARLGDRAADKTMNLANQFVPTSSNANLLAELLVEYAVLAKTHLEPRLRFDLDLKAEMDRLLP